MSDFDFLTEPKTESTDTVGPQEEKTTTKKSTVPVAKTKKRPSKNTRIKAIGRPANGKRSNPDWVGRTFYVEAETDANFGIVIATLKAQGVSVDKSDIVQALLSEWMGKTSEAKLKWCRSKLPKP